MNRFSTDESSIAENLTAWDIPSAAYIHIPFCRRRCFYCDFPVSVIGDRLRGETSGSIQQYVTWLVQEIQATPSQGNPLTTIFFGGGTPSLLAPDQVQIILEALVHQFGIHAQPEISMEMDPGTFDLAHAQAYQRTGINRVSLGVQTFQDQLLRDCGRTYTVQQIYEAVDLVHQAGFSNLSLDLISGLPHQTLAQWQDSLKQAIALNPTHLSAYDLVLEPGTVFGKQFAPGETPLPTDDHTAQMYRIAVQMLRTAGYDHYEISNYAQPNFQCRHNAVYWRNASYYGFGMGATSYIEGQRFSRPRTRASYAQWLETYIVEGGCLNEPITTEGDRLFETLMLGLRRSQGVDLRALESKYQRSIHQILCETLTSEQAEGWVKLNADGRMLLTDPEGFLFSNRVLVSIWQSLLDKALRQSAIN